MKNLVVFLFLTSIACNKITSGSDLETQDISRIQKLGILGKDEIIIQFYSQLYNEAAGNFFTQKRIASYWIDQDDSAKTKINSAFLKDVISMDTVVYAGATYAPFIRVTTKDSAEFNVYFDGGKNEIRKTFIQAIGVWRKQQKEFAQVVLNEKSAQKKPIETVKEIFDDYVKYDESTDSKDDKTAMEAALQTLAKTKNSVRDLKILLDVWMYYDPTDFPIRDLIVRSFNETGPRPKKPSTNGSLTKRKGKTRIRLLSPTCSNWQRIFHESAPEKAFAIQIYVCF